MKIRKITFNIEYIHILTFSVEYRKIVAPYFSYDNLKYAVNNPNTIEESIIFTYQVECFNLQFRKDGMTLVFEGDVNEVKKANPIVQIYFEIYEKFKKIEGYTKTPRHRMIIQAVDIESKEIVTEQLKNNIFLKNPFGELEEFACIYTFNKNNYKATFHFGNYSEEDIKKFNLSQFKPDYNKDLKENIGFMCQLTLVEDLVTNIGSSFSKFKSLISEGESVIKTFEDNLYEKIRQ